MGIKRTLRIKSLLGSLKCKSIISQSLNCQNLAITYFLCAVNRFKVQLWCFKEEESESPVQFTAKLNLKERE